MDKNQDNFISIQDIFIIIGRGKKVIIFSTMSFFILAIIYLMLVQHKYAGSLHVGPNQSSLSEVGEGSGLSSFIGVSKLLGSAPTGQYSVFIEYLTSEMVATELLKTQKVKSVIFSTQWDSDNNVWRKPAGFLQVLKGVKTLFGRPSWVPPSGVTLANILRQNLSTDPVGKTGFHKISYLDKDPDFAKYMLMEIISIADDKIRSGKLEQVTLNIGYVKKRLSTEVVSDVRKELANIVGAQEKQKMLLESDHPYTYSSLDNITVSATPVKPRILVVIMLGLIGGLFFGLFVTFIRYVLYI